MSSVIFVIIYLTVAQPLGPPYHDAVLSTPGLLAYYRLNEQPGSSSAADETLTHPGSVVGSVSFGVAGPASDCFDGFELCNTGALFATEGRIEVADDNALDFGVDQDFSVEAWFKHEGVDEVAYLVVKGFTDASYWLRLEANGTLRFLLDYGVVRDFAQSPDPYDDGAWHHVVGVADRVAGISLFVDGAIVDEDTTLTVGDISNPHVLKLGAGKTNFVNFDGNLDEVAIYNRALSPEEIAQHFTVGQGKADTCPTDLDRNGHTGIVDFLNLLAAWGPCVGCIEDVDCDCDVGITDFLTLLAAWGPC